MSDRPIVGVVHPDSVPHTPDDERRRAEMQLEVSTIKRLQVRIAELEAREARVRALAEEWKMFKHPRSRGGATINNFYEALRDALDCREAP